MPILEQFLVTPTEQEFLNFCNQRMEGLQLTEDDATIEIYRKAIQLGLKELEQKEVQR